MGIWQRLSLWATLQEGMRYRTVQLIAQVACGRRMCVASPIRQGEGAQRLTFRVRRPPDGEGILPTKEWASKSSFPPAKVHSLPSKPRKIVVSSDSSVVFVWRGALPRLSESRTFPSNGLRCYGLSILMKSGGPQAL